MTTKRNGRPPIVVDVKQVERLAAIQCTDQEIAFAMGVDIKTLKRALKRQGFGQAIETGAASGTMSLRREQFRVALKGNATMLIWLGRQYLGQADVHELRPAAGVAGVPLFMVSHEAAPHEPKAQ